MSDSNEPEQTPSKRDPTEPDAHEPYGAPTRHNPAFPSWRYAGLRWLADRLYGDGRSKD
jgi:hypothetical protein